MPRFFTRTGRAGWQRALALIGLTLAMGGCVGSAEAVWAPDEVVAQARYVPPEAPKIQLITMINNRSGSGGHSALLIDGSERVLFDPAGSWFHPLVPERNDVLFGMSPQLYGFYTDYHARETFHVVVQELDVSPGQAAALMQAAQSYGAVPPARCSIAVSSVLASVPGFEGISSNLFPARTMQQFAQIPGVRETRIYDDDSDDNYELLNAQARAAASADEAREVLQ